MTEAVVPHLTTEQQPTPKPAAKPKVDWRERVRLTFNNLINMYVQTETLMPEILMGGGGINDDHHYGILPFDWVEFQIEVAEWNRTHTLQIKASTAIQGTSKERDMDNVYDWNLRHRIEPVTGVVDATAEAVTTTTDKKRVWAYIHSDDQRHLNPTEIKGVLALFRPILHDNLGVCDLISELKSKYAINRRD